MNYRGNRRNFRGKPNGFSRRPFISNKRRPKRKLNRNGERANKTVTILDYTKNENRMIMLNEPGRFCPDRTFAKLRFTDHDLARGLLASTSANWRYQSSALTPNPSVGTNDIVGYVELTNLYQRARVHSMKLHLEMFNQQTQAMLGVIWPSTFSYTTNSLTANDILDYSLNPAAHSMLMGGSGSNGRINITSLASGLELIGPEFARDEDYSSTIIANPTRMFYINIGVVSTAGNMTALMPIRVVIDYEIEFYERWQLDV